MKSIKIKDKEFVPMISEAEIKERVKAVAQQISKDMEGKNPLLLAVLNGSFVFAADLMRYLTIECEISFVKVASYAGTSSTGTVRKLIGVNADLKGRDVIIVEDIGSKMPEDRIPYLFHWFDNPEVDRDDAEIDLSIIFKLALKIDGYLEYDPTYTQGTRMKLIF